MGHTGDSDDEGSVEDIIARQRYTSYSRQTPLE